MLLVVFVCTWCVACHVTSAAVELKADALSAATDVEEFCFVSYGCWGGLNKVTQKRVADVMGEVVSASPLPTLFVIAAGDNFYRRGVPNVRDERFLTTFDNVYNHPSLLGLPFLVALGNHDYRGNFFAQVNYTTYQLTSVPQSTGRWYLPSAYYVKQVHKHLVIFVLDAPLLERCANNGDSSPRCWDQGAQKQFFEDQLERFKDIKWKVVVSHYPMHANGPHVNHAWLISWLQPLLERYCVDLFINADNHYLQVSETNGVYYVNSGGGAGFGVRHLSTNKNYQVSPHNKFIAFEDGVFYHCVHNDSIVSTAVNQDGAQKFTFTSNRGAQCEAHGRSEERIAGGNKIHSSSTGQRETIAPLQVPSSAHGWDRMATVAILLVVGLLCLARGRHWLSALRKKPRDAS